MKRKSFKELFKEAKERGTYWAASIILDFTEGLHKIMEANGSGCPQNPNQKKQLL
jgi:hypothetical protein